MISALLALSPVLSLINIALSSTGEVHYALMRHLSVYVLPSATMQTCLLLAGVALVAGSTGIATAWTVTMYQFKGRGLLLWLLPLPLAVPTYITAYCYAELFEPLGVVQTTLRSIFDWNSRSDYWFPEVRSTYGAVFIMSSVVYPYVYLAARVMFATQSSNLLEASRTMGATQMQMVRFVALPLARPALAVGIALALLEVLNDVGASEYLGVRTLTLTIMNTWLNTGNLAGAAMIALMLIVIAVILITIEAYGRRNQRYGASLRKSRTPTPHNVEGMNGLGLFMMCMLAPLWGFLIPVGFLIKECIARGLLLGFDHDLWSHTYTTFKLAAWTTAIVLPIGFIAAYAVRQRQSLTSTCAFRLSGLGYAMPGTVLALGLLSPLAMVDTSIRNSLASIEIKITGVFLMGTIGALIVAYVIRFQSLATGAIHAGFSRISPHLDMAARNLGASSREIIMRIHLPLLTASLASAALMIFVDTLKELPATLLLRPLNGETLATRLYTLASQGQFESGAHMALMIIIIGLGPVMILTRITDRMSKSQNTSFKT